MDEITFINKIDKFNKLIDDYGLKATSISLFYAILYLIKIQGKKDKYYIRNSELEIYSGMGSISLSTNRDLLKQYEIIDYKSNGHGSAPEYIILI